jgi:lipid A 3-O-deacylase
MHGYSVCSMSSCPAVAIPRTLPQNRRSANHFSFYLENDYFVGDDSQYTNGLKFAWSSPVHTGYPKEVWPHRWFYPVIRILPFDDFFDSAMEKNITLSFGQNIYTPEDIEEKILSRMIDLMPASPICPWVFTAALNPRQKTLEFYVGLVGPQSYAEECQQFVHKIVKDIEPMGMGQPAEK